MEELEDRELALTGLSALATHPVGRFGNVAEIAHGGLYLASGEAKLVIGSVVAIDGRYAAQ